MDNGISNLSLEAVMAMTERTIKRLWILCLVLIAFLLLSNGAWIIYESQFESYRWSDSHKVSGGRAIPSPALLMQLLMQIHASSCCFMSFPFLKIP